MTGTASAEEPRSFYIGPQKSRLEAGSWNAIETALTAGLLDETQWVELKEAVPPASKPANIELAKDLASLSVGGGVLVIGVADKKREASAVVGAVLDGLQDRISQVSQAAIDPPLSLTFDGPYAHPECQDRGVLIVVVPPSPGAPHMVDGSYWGRSPNGKRKLPNNEVRLLLEARRTSADAFQTRVERLAHDLDASAERVTTNSHLYLLAEPAVTPTPLRVPADLAPGDVAKAVGYSPAQYPVLLTSGMRTRGHADGHLWTSGEPHGAPIDEHGLVRLLIKDEGAIQVVASASGEGRTLASELIRVLHPDWILDFVNHLVHLVRYLSETHLAYSGSWRFGIHLDRMAGMRAAEAVQPPFLVLDPFVKNEYFAATEAGMDQLRNHPHLVVERLLQRLFRGLSIEQARPPYRPPL